MPADPHKLRQELAHFLVDAIRTYGLAAVVAVSGDVYGRMLASADEVLDLFALQMREAAADKRAEEAE